MSRLKHVKISYIFQVTNGNYVGDKKRTLERNDTRMKKNVHAFLIKSNPNRHMVDKQLTTNNIKKRINTTKVISSHLSFPLKIKTEAIKLETKSSMLIKVY